MSNKNANKANYKYTSLGWIPKDWEVKRFKEVTAKIVDGTHFSPSSTEGPFKYITSKNIRNEGLDLTDVGYISKEEHEGIFKRCPVALNDILLTKDGAATGACCKNTLSESFSLLSSVAVIRGDNKNCLNDFLLQFIKSPKGQNIIKDAIAGQAITRITLEKIRGFQSVVPSLFEQKKIVEILSTWDRAIKTIEQLVNKLQVRNNGFLQKLLTAKGHWNECQIGDLLKAVKRPVRWQDNELYHLISVRRRSGGAFHRESLYGHQILTKQLYTAKSGDFLISKMQIVHGASAVVPPELDSMKISGSYIALHSSANNILDINFFNWLSKTKWFYRLTYVSSYGVHIEKMTFDFADFKRRKIMLPPIEEQTKTIQQLQTAEKEVKFYKQKLNLLKEQKKGLMQKLLTGEVRIKH